MSCESLLTFEINAVGPITEEHAVRVLLDQMPLCNKREDALSAINLIVGCSGGPQRIYRYTEDGTVWYTNSSQDPR
jgi:hypothetical protein